MLEYQEKLQNLLLINHAGKAELAIVQIVKRFAGWKWKLSAWGYFDVDRSLIFKVRLSCSQNFILFLHSDLEIGVTFA